MQQKQGVDPLNTDHLHADLRGRSVRGGVVNITSQGAQFLVMSVSTVVLARLLTPADFGLVAMVSTITGLAQAFADLGLSEATIQRRDISHDQVSILFWINLAIGVGLMLITMALAPFLAKFYRDPRLVRITLIVSLTFLFGGLRVQPDAVLKRQMRFAFLAVRDVACCVIAVALAITLALKGATYWALVALPLTLNGTQMLFSWLMVNWTPSLPRRGVDVGSMIVFGGNVAASYFTMSVSRTADNILIGRYLGAAPLGLYSRAYNLLMLPVRQLSGPTGSVAVPAFSRLQTDPERFARYYLRAVHLMMWIAAPIFAFLFVAARPVVVLTLGKQWGGAAPVFQILAISALAQLLLDSTVWLFVSRGQSQQLLKLLLVISPIIIVSYALGLPFGIEGVALSGSLTLLCILPWTLKYAFRGTRLNLKNLSRTLLYPISVSTVGVLVSEIVLHLARPEQTLPQLGIISLSFVVTYSLLGLFAPVRDEVVSLKNLAKELRSSR